MYRGYALADGTVSGKAVVLDEPLSFWGGMDLSTGTVVDQRHPQAGVGLGGKILVMPSGRGSSSSSSVLAEAIRTSVAPRGIILRHPDEIVALGAMVAAELYAIMTPVVTLDDGYDDLRSGDTIQIEASVDSATVCVS